MPCAKQDAGMLGGGLWRPISHVRKVELAPP